MRDYTVLYGVLISGGVTVRAESHQEAIAKLEILGVDELLAELLADEMHDKEFIVEDVIREPRNSVID